MSTEDTITERGPSGRWDFDSPWRRLPWTLPAALLIWVVTLWALALFVGKSDRRQVLPPPLEARLIEQAPPAQPPPPPPHERIIPPKIPMPLPRPAPAPVPKPVEQKPAVQPAPAPVQQRPQGQTAPGTGVHLPVTQTDLGAGPGTGKSDAFVSRPVQGGGGAGAVPFGGPPGLAGKGEYIAPPQFGVAYLNNPLPVYPALARRMRMEGTVMLKVLVSKDGSPLKVEVASTSRYEVLDKAAAEAVKNWRFIPARQGDTQVDAWVQVPVAFHLER